MVSTFDIAKIYFQISKEKRKEMEKLEDDFYQTLAQKKRVNNIEDNEDTNVSIAGERKMDQKQNGRDKCQNTNKSWW